MRTVRVFGCGLLVLGMMAAPGGGRAAVPGPELGGTFSIVAYDSTTGEVGVAVQSHWFSVGSAVPWARAGVGAVATQSFVELSYGPKLLERLAAGEEPDSALWALLAADTASAMRQVGVVDARGRVAAHTGASCVSHAGDIQGAAFSCQGNLLASDRVWPEMARAFTEGAGQPLPERMIRALEAGQAAGGDARGVQSAAILVEKPVSETEPWKNREIDLRVEDSLDPIGELRRLYTVWKAYRLADEGDGHLARGDWTGAYDSYDAALQLLPENDELLFWRGSMGYAAGRPDSALADVRRAIAINPRWQALLPRIDETVFPGVTDVRKKLGIEAGTE